MRDWFVKKLLAAVKGGGAVVVTAKEHAHLLACKDVCAEVKSSMQYLKQCATEQQRREYHVLMTAAAPRRAGQKARTAGGCSYHCQPCVQLYIVMAQISFLCFINAHA